MMKKIACFLLLLSVGLFFACSKETILEAKADFSFEIEKEDYSVPVWINFINNSSGAETFQWTFEGGQPASFEGRNPGRVYFNIPGDHIITLVVANKDGSKDVKTETIKIDSALNIKFNVVWQSDSFSPATVLIHNLADGSDSYSWIFEGGNPATASEQHPTSVTFNTPGPHTIRLAVTNGREHYEKDTVINVAAHLEAVFDYTHDPANEGWEAPITLHMDNQSISATSYQWSTTGNSNISAPNGSTPNITFTQAGTYTIKLRATNGKETQETTKEITVLPNTNLRVLQDVKFGINTAHNTIGSYFSASKRGVFPADSLSTLGSQIDFAFYGLNNLFTYNRFVAADQTSQYGLPPILNASGHCQIINSQEFSGLGFTFTEAMFDGMTNDVLLQTLSFSESPAGLQPFSDLMVPRIVLFKTASGIKGAIKIKQFVANGQQSYIITDIKYIKQP